MVIYHFPVHDKFAVEVHGAVEISPLFFVMAMLVGHSLNFS